MPDDLIGSRYALEGRVVTMNDSLDVLERGIIYIDAGHITAVQDESEPPAPEFADAPLVRTGGTIYPGLIELHNHLSYNVLPFWEVPTRFMNRGDWRSLSSYKQSVSRLMALLATVDGSAAAIARYVESKCLLSGVTTSQGIRFISNQGIVRDYPGLVRNAESPDDPNLPKARTRVSDVTPADVQHVFEDQNECECYLLHLCEGVDADTHKYFDVFHLQNGEWAITKSLSGIHSICLTKEDFNLLKTRDASVIWSPLSNHLLYGDTMDIAAAKSSQVTIGIGSDWSPSGSKNLLCELKVARLVSQNRNNVFTDAELVSMATRNAARILGWQDRLGSIEKGKLADLLVLHGRQGDPYAKLLTSRETTIILVVIGGVPRCGQERLMKKFKLETEAWTVGRSKRALHLENLQPDALPEHLTLAEAKNLLRENLLALPQLASDLENAPPATLHALRSGAQERWTVVLDLEGEDESRLFNLASSDLLAPEVRAFGAPVPLSQLIQPIELDEITVVDDRRYFDRLGTQINLPEFIKSGLPELY